MTVPLSTNPTEYYEKQAAILEGRKQEVSYFNFVLLALIICTIAIGIACTYDIVNTLKEELKTNAESLGKLEAHSSTLIGLTTGHVESISEILSKIKTLEAIEFIKDYETKIGLAKREIKSSKDVKEPAPTSGSIEQAMAHVTAASNALAELDRHINSVEKLRKITEDHKAAIEAHQAQLKTVRPPSTIGFMIAEVIVRIGILLLIVYLSQVLVSIYKYNVQLSNHYMALADSIRLCLNRTDGSINMSILSEASKILSTNALNFGVSENTPTKEIGELARAVADLRKTSTPE